MAIAHFAAEGAVTPMTKGSEQHKPVRYLAHVRRDGETFVPHDLDEHLRGVAQRADECVRDFGGGDWAQVAGLWHDLGKYSAEFQRRIKSVSGYDLEAHLEGPVGRVDHSTAGAQYAVAQFGVHGRILAYLGSGVPPACRQARRKLTERASNPR